VVETVEADLPEGAVLALEGSVRALHVVSVAAPLDGVLEEIPVAPGDEVFEGQILGRIANEVLEQNERNALLELERAQARLVGSLERTACGAVGGIARVGRCGAGAVGVSNAPNGISSGSGCCCAKVRRREIRTTRRKACSRRRRLSPKPLPPCRARFRIASSSRRGRSRRHAQVLAQEEEDLEAARLDLRAAQVMAPVDGLIIAIRKSAGSEVHREVDVLFDIGVDLTALEVVLEPEPPVLKRMQAGLPAWWNWRNCRARDCPAPCAPWKTERCMSNSRARRR
jgi:multidrug efflux pump subunit AcrA (membrane-fusion protein)